MAPEKPESPPPPPPAPPVRYAVTAPGPVTGGVMGVAFANGQAIAAADKHGRALDWFRAEGYSVELIETGPVPPADEEPAVPEPAVTADETAPDEELPTRKRSDRARDQ